MKKYTMFNKMKKKHRYSYPRLVLFFQEDLNYKDKDDIFKIVTNRMSAHLKGDFK